MQNVLHARNTVQCGKGGGRNKRKHCDWPQTTVRYIGRPKENGWPLSPNPANPTLLLAVRTGSPIDESIIAD
ncbi:hypothetical protein BofuT4_uP080740.1 [Botrytis cinerea T4]|uniref:Uncharacterized protein n=1 Tax=Botryotinia fuckeliana (strain T4) TaxID=999810 RepID=G2YKY1_BOTF4|nr:hypothetical protein BofuT4_uP080740.1 [Botrytis cinerea T4]